MKFHRSSCVLISLLSFHAAAWAWQGNPPGGQSPNPCLPFEPSNTIDWNPAYGSAASFGRMVIGKFSSSSETDRDAVIVAGGVAVHAHIIASYKLLAPVTFPTQPALSDVTDVATLPGGGPLGKDALLATDSRGLLKTHYQGTFVQPPPPGGGFVDPMVIEGSAWVDAGPIHVVDANAQGGLDIIGVAAGGAAILTLIENGGSYTPGAIPVPRAIFGVAVSNWDSDPEREYVVLTNGGLFIYTLAGVLDTVVPYSASAGAIDRVTWPAEGGTAEFIAWGRPTAGGGELVVLNRTRIDSTVPLSLSSCQPIAFVPKAILAGHYNDGGFEDLLLVHEADRTAVVLVNNELSSGSQHFSLSTSWHDVIPLSPSFVGPTGVGLPAFDQVDGDGPEDLAFPVRVTAKVQVFQNMNRFRFTEPQGGQPPTSNEVIDDQCIYMLDSQTYQKQLRVTVQIPQLYQSFPKMQLILYRKDEAILQVDEACANTLYNLLPGAANPFQIVEVLHTPPGFPATIPPGPGGVWSEPRPYYYVEVRFVNHNGAMSPRYFAGMTLRNALVNPSYDHLLPQGIPPLMWLDDPTATESGVHVGAYIPMSSAPAFASGVPTTPQTTGEASPYTDNGI